jgi:hypothetical protein
MAANDRTRAGGNSNATVIAALVIGICLAIGAIVWAGGWGFSNDQVASPNPAAQPGNTSPAAQMPARSTTGSR